MSNQYDVFSNRRFRFQQSRQSRNRGRRTRYTPQPAPQAPPPLVNPTSPLSYVYRTTIPDESTTLLNLINRAVGQDPTFFIYSSAQNSEPPGGLEFGTNSDGQVSHIQPPPRGGGESGTWRYPPVNFQDAVPIVPTPAQLQAGSVLQTSIGVEDATCSICQQNMVNGETIRHLTVCHHKFHRDCIDQWFQRNVRCPVCRHDIRLGPSA